MVQIPRAALRITEPISSINLVQQILRDRYKFQFNSNPAQNSTQHNPHDVKLDVKRSILKTSLAQRQSAGLITPRSADQNPQEVFSHSPALQKRVVIAQATLNLSNTSPAWRRRAVSLPTLRNWINTNRRYFAIYSHVFEYIIFLLSLSLSMHLGNMICILRYIVET